MRKGQVVILLMVGIALGMAGYSCWYHYQKGNQILDLLGQQATSLIRHAPRVQLLKLAKNSTEMPAPTDKAGSLHIGNHDVPIVKSENISAMKGLVHARHTLVVDQSYRWHEPVKSSDPCWDFAMQFVDGDREVTLVFSVSQRLVQALDHDQPVLMTEAIDRIAEFLEPSLQLFHQAEEHDPPS